MTAPLPVRHRPSLRIGLLTSARTWRGSTVSLSGIASGLRARGHDVRLLVGEEEIGATLRAMSLPVDLLPTKNTGLKEAMTLRQLLRKHRIQALLADRPRDLRLGALASLDRKIPLVYRFNVRRERPPTDLMTRLAYQRVAATIFLTPGWAERTLNRAPFMSRVPYRVIWNGVDIHSFQPNGPRGESFRARLSLGEGPVLVASGALYPEKRFDVLIDAVSRLKRRPPLVVCGAGVEEPRLRAQAERLAAPVIFTGFLSHDEMVDAYNAATCVLHACPVETFGRSVAEAMACARPVIAAGEGAVVDVVGNAGILVEPDNPAAMAQALEDLLPDTERQARLGNAARARCVERFSQERSLSDYEGLFLELVRW